MRAERDEEREVKETTMKREQAKWTRISRDDYESADGRWAIVRLPGALNAYAHVDEWTLIERASDCPVDVYPRLRDAKAAAAEL